MHLSNGPSQQSPNRVIIHAMGEYIKTPKGVLYAPDFLEKIGLSAHALVTPHKGVMRCRDDNEGAWHAKGFNKDSLGIEFLVEGMHNYSSFLKAIKMPYLTDSQYENGVKFVLNNWVLTKRILRYDRHSDVDPKRKFDPGNGFPWLKFLVDIGVTI